MFVRCCRGASSSSDDPVLMVLARALPLIQWCLIMATEVEGAPSVRLFFALWLAAGMAGSLHRVAEGVVGRCGGRLLKPESFHLTLAFLGDVPEYRLPELLKLISGVTLPTVDVWLDKVDYWKHNQILWAGCREPAPALVALAAKLQEELLAAGFLTETRPLLPHVTLVRKLFHPGALPELGCFEWRAEELVLARSCRSDRGSEYDAIARWPLV